MSCGILNMMSFRQFLFESAKAEDALNAVRNALIGSKYEQDVYLVGGAVRDMQMGLPVKDLDLVVDNHGLEGGIECATFLAKALGVYRPDSNPVIFPRFGTAKLTLKSGFDVEFVAPRKEKYDANSRKPVVSAGTLEDDAFRRDFTINSLFMRLSNSELRDLTGRGLADLKRKTIQTTSDATYIFSEDPLRMLRAVRFAIKYDFELPLALIKAIKVNARRLQTISKERIQDELNKILVLKKPSRAIRLFKITGLLKEFMPELQSLSGVTQNAYHKHDAFDHTLDVLDNAPPDLTVRLAALFHDIGKAATRTDDGGKVRFLGHANVGADIAVEVMKRLKYSNDDTEKIRKIVFHHMDMKFAGDDLATLKDKSLRKLIFRVADKLDPLLSLMHADNISHAEHANMPNQIDRIRQRIKDWDIESILNTTSVLDGNEIAALGAKGPLIGKIKGRILDKVLETPSFSKKDATLLAQSMIRDAAGKK
jgi:poly(A) polymerase